MEEWDPANNDFYWDIIAAGGEQTTSMSKLSVLHVKNIIVNTVWVSMIYSIDKPKNWCN